MGVPARGRRATASRTPHPALRATFSHKGRRNLSGDRGNDAVEIFEHLIVPEAQDAIAFAVQEAGAHLILREPLRMLAAIDLDDQLRTMRSEVGDIRAKGHLAPELGGGKALAKRTPQALLRAGRIPAQASGALSGAGGKTMPFHPLPLHFFSAPRPEAGK